MEAEELVLHRGDNYLGEGGNEYHHYYDEYWLRRQWWWRQWWSPRLDGCDGRSWDWNCDSDRAAGNNNTVVTVVSFVDCETT